MLREYVNTKQLRRNFGCLQTTFSILTDCCKTKMRNGTGGRCGNLDTTCITTSSATRTNPFM